MLQNLVRLYINNITTIILTIIKLIRLYSYEIVNRSFNKEPLPRICIGNDIVVSCEKILTSDVEHKEHRPKFGNIYILFTTLIPLFNSITLEFIEKLSELIK